MLDDLETNLMQEDKSESTSNKFSLTPFNLPGSPQNVNILSMSVSKKFIYLVTDHSELLRIESDTLKPIQQAYSMKPKDGKAGKFHEFFTKIWTDRAGNHSIIRDNGRIYYFNSFGSFVKELDSLRGIEVCAVGFDDRNTNKDTTGSFLLTDFNNNIYECNIKIGKIETNGDYQVKDSAEILTTLSFKDWDEDDDDNDPRKKNYDRIYGIKFFRATRETIDQNENACYIIAVTKNKFYQFIGPGTTSFKQIFGRYHRQPNLFNDSCKYFPQILKRKGNFIGSDLDILYRTEQRSVSQTTSKKLEVFNQFGWKTESGYCYGFFKYDNNLKSTGLPHELKNFTVVPFAKITSSGKKETGIEPICILHTVNHIFILYKDCISVISKLTSNIIHTQYFQTEYEQMIYNEFAENNGIILLSSKNGLYKMSLKDENYDIWKDYLEIGDYTKALNFCNSDKLKRIINRIDADYEFEEKKNGFNAANKFVNSDEKFEIVCLKYLMRNDIDGLNLFLQLYMGANVRKEEKNKKIEKEDTFQLFLLCTLLIEIFLKQHQTSNKSSLDEFRVLVRENLKYLNRDLMYPLLKNYGKIDEFVELASMMGDSDKVINYYINNGEIDSALNKITEFSTYEENLNEKLKKVFLDNCHIFFKNNPKESISFIQKRFKDVKMEKIVQSILSTTDKDITFDKIDINDELKKKKMENHQAILSYLKSLVEKSKIEEENNIHNLYIYYLSRNKVNQEAILEYLKAPLKSNNSKDVFGKKKKEVLFQLDYGKKLFKDNPPAYSLVLALMGKYSEAVRTALDQKTEDCLKIAKFIASNAPGEKLKKQLWIDIFSYNNQNEFGKALDIMKESKILKIEDVLPKISDTIKIEEFKKQISNCIDEYESNIKKLKEDISSYNKTAENIKSDIYKVQKKSMEIQYSNCKCDICQGFIKDKNIFLFPCGHMFDMNCIKDSLLNYEITGIDNIHEKNVKIDELFFKLGYITKRSFIKSKKDEGEEIETAKTEEAERAPSGFFNRIMDFTIFKKQENQDPKKEAENKALKDELNELLSEQCVLCGDFMVDSLQCSFSQRDDFIPDKDNLKIKFTKEPEFLF